MVNTSAGFMQEVICKRQTNSNLVVTPFLFRIRKIFSQYALSLVWQGLFLSGEKWLNSLQTRLSACIVIIR